MKDKTLEEILFQVYELGVQQTDCDLTKRVNTIQMLANQRVINENLNLIERLSDYIPCEVFTKEVIRIKELKQ